MCSTGHSTMSHARTTADRGAGQGLDSLGTHVPTVLLQGALEEKSGDAGFFTDAQLAPGGKKTVNRKGDPFPLEATARPRPAQCRAELEVFVDLHIPR